MTTVDSCHSHWVFDPDGLRYRRVPQGPDVHLRVLGADWQPYHELHLDEQSDSFVVVLNQEGTRMLRSWRHRQGECPSCGRGTAELGATTAATVDAGPAR
ncbi:MAG TPA: hypothetical protein VMU09_04455 [Acidimicrobiales bacterium]|nr:hypothetical protein [Acidimicrobiales bacterium]